MSDVLNSYPFLFGSNIFKDKLDSFDKLAITFCLRCCQSELCILTLVGFLIYPLNISNYAHLDKQVVKG